MLNFCQHCGEFLEVDEVDTCSACQQAEEVADAALCCICGHSSMDDTPYLCFDHSEVEAEL
jgi:hypothetical protein